MNGASFAAAARGPVSMIVVGILFAADHAGSVSISRSWPILLIVFGAMRLWEYLGTKQA